MAEPQKNKPEAIVLARLSALGDVAMTIPAVYDLCRAYPRNRVVLVTRSWMTGMFVNPPSNLTVEGIDLKNDYKGVFGIYRLSKYLTGKYHIKAFIDLHDVLRTKILRCFFKLKGVRVTVIDKGRKEKKKLVALGAAGYFKCGGKELPTTLQRYRDTIFRAGYDSPEDFKPLFESKVVTDGVLRIGIAPFAAHEGKIYPLDKMSQVVDALAEKDNTEVYLFGAGYEESAILESWRKERQNVINMAALRKGLASEMKLMATLDVMLAMDSGNMHLAAVAGMPRIVSVWGATHPSAGFAPYRFDAEDMIGSETECRPCSVYGNKPCRYGDMRCLNSISPQQIVDKVLKNS